MTTMQLSEPHFTHVEKGDKKFELRVLDEKRRKIQERDVIKMISREDEEKFFFVRVKSIKVYSSFEEAIEDTKLDHLLPGMKTKDLAILLYNSFPGYEEGAVRDGVVRFELELI